MTDLGKESQMTRNLVDNVLGEQSLHEHDQQLVLLGQTLLLSLLVHLGVGHAPFARTLVPNHLAKRFVRTATFLVIIVGSQHERALQFGIELRHASRNSFFARVDRPIVFGFALTNQCRRLRVRHDLSRTSFNLLRQLVSIVVIRPVGTVATAHLSRLTRNRVCTRHGFLATTDFLAFGWVLENKRGELVTHVNVGPLSARFAITVNEIVLGDDQFRLGVLARAAQDKFVDKDVEQIAQTGRLVGAVDNVTLRVVIERGLSTELVAEKFGRVCDRRDRSALGCLMTPRLARHLHDEGRLSARATSAMLGMTVKSRVRQSAPSSNQRSIPCTSLDAIAFALDLGQKDGHPEAGQRDIQISM